MLWIGFEGSQTSLALPVFNVHALGLLTVKSPTAVVGVMQIFHNIRATLIKLDGFQHFVLV